MKKIMLRYEAEQLSINCEKFINTFMAYFIKDNGLNIENMPCEEFEIYKEMISLMKKLMEYSVHQAQKLDYIEDRLCEIERKLTEKKV